ncbi:uncharacterized protein LOC111583812 [Amphiprion ocellaris]|uniref:uncharacterized protein LOC111583812 n=1 Tax=Amphiprion ocellaris TaxID=80972 RepID=UPI002410C6DB|nr:uncharacterized protein LOC111583812 [Amphiprion ocellaris]
MSLSSLLIRTLLCLLLVSTATAELTCWQQVPPVLIRDLWNQSRLLINDLPTENSSVQHRFLPNFCTKCPELVIGWSDMKALIDVYQRSVFKRSAVQKLLPLHYPEMMHRLQHTLQRCVSSSETPKHLKLIQKREQKIEKRLGDKGALKAVEELDFVFSWIDELLHHRVQ